jgi:RNA-directed DNA polymerase
MTTTSVGVQELRTRIGEKAKAEPEHRFWGLYTHVWKLDVLREAYRLAKQNHGAPGVDGVTFAQLEAQGVEGLLEALSQELQSKTYAPLPCRQVNIPKAGGKVRGLKIPAIRDRVVQGAVRLILEPIFEADLTKVRRFASRQRPKRRGGRTWTTWSSEDIYESWGLFYDYGVSWRSESR